VSSTSTATAITARPRIRKETGPVLMAVIAPRSSGAGRPR
jgi:hypothetical protein